MGWSVSIVVVLYVLFPCHIIVLYCLAESFATKGTVIKGIRRHAKRRTGEVRYMFTHYFVRLEEGTPPKDYYLLNPRTPQQQLDDWLEQMRQRKIKESL